MDRSQLPEYIFGLMPVLHRKLLRRRPQSDIPRQWMNVLNTISFHDGMPMKFYGEKRSISKPNLTKVVNGLIELGYVTREHSEADRRVITIHITEEGRSKVKEHFDDLSEQIIEGTSVLSDDEVQELIDCFETINRIVAKLEDSDKEGCCR